jgi:hypothetical protein
MSALGRSGRLLRGAYHEAIYPKFKDVEKVNARPLDCHLFFGCFRVRGLYRSVPTEIGSQQYYQEVPKPPGKLDNEQ